jgi:hypothetical protein
LDRILRFGLVALIALAVVTFPGRAVSEAPAPVIEVIVHLTDLPPAVVNVTVPEQSAPTFTFPDQSPTINVQVTGPELPAPQVIYQDRTVEVQVDREVVVERLVEVERVVEVERLVEVERVVEVPVEVIIVCNPVDGRERSFAFIDGGLVTNLAGGSGRDFENYLEAVADQGMEVTCVFPRPAIGWTFVDGVFAPPS